MGTDNSLKKSLMLGKIEGRRRRGHQKMRWLNGVTDAMDMNLGKLREMVRDGEAWRAAVHRIRHDWPAERLSLSMFYNVVLVSALQQCESAITIFIVVVVQLPSIV